MHTTDSLRQDGYLQAPPAPSADAALDQAMLRSYPAERCLDYGCALEDVLKLRRRVEAGHGWDSIALQLAGDNEARAAFEAQAGRAASASRFYLQAAACCRLAQAGLEHDVPARLRVYLRQAGNFRAAMEHTADGPPAEHLEILHRERSHHAWLFRAPGFAQVGATVVVWGGADGWGEAFHAAVPAYLEKGLSVCLLELPGQGLARLAHGSMLGTDFTAVVSGLLDALVARGAAPDRFGVIGHSAGGSLAIAAAAADARIVACCTNGGSPEPRVGAAKFPRVLQRIGRMLGHDTSEAEVLAFFDALDLPHAARHMRARLLCLHGGQDILVGNDEMQRLVELRGAEATTFEVWPEGVHCLYNHSNERNSVLTTWFARELLRDTPAGSPSPEKLP